MTVICHRQGLGVQPVPWHPPSHQHTPSFSSRFLQAFALPHPHFRLICCCCHQSCRQSSPSWPVLCMNTLHRQP